MLKRMTAHENKFLHPHLGHGFLFCVYRNRRRNQCTAAQQVKYKLLFSFFHLSPTQFLSYSGTNRPTEMADHFS